MIYGPQSQLVSYQQLKFSEVEKIITFTKKYRIGYYIYTSPSKNNILITGREEWYSSRFPINKFLGLKN